MRHQCCKLSINILLIDKEGKKGEWETLWQREEEQQYYPYLANISRPEIVQTAIAFGYTHIP